MSCVSTYLQSPEPLYALSRVSPKFKLTGVAMLIPSFKAQPLSKSWVLPQDESAHLEEISFICCAKELRILWDRRHWVVGASSWSRSRLSKQASLGSTRMQLIWGLTAC